MCERNPVNYALVRNADCFDPRQMKSASASTLRQKMKNVTTYLVSAHVIQTAEADEALKQYTTLLEKKDTFDEYDKSSGRVDDYFFKTIGINDQLGEVAKAMFSLSHGQADVERGFSINKKAIKDNQGERSLVARRQIKDFMQINKYQAHKVPKTPALLSECRQSNKRYKDALEKERQQKTLTSRDIEKAQITKDIKEVDRKIKELEEAAILHNSKADKKFEKANKQKEMSEMKSYLTQGQSLKELAKKARADAETLI